MIGAGPRAKRNGPEKLFGVCAFFGLASTAGVRGASQYLRPLCVAVWGLCVPFAARFPARVCWLALACPAALAGVLLAVAVARGSQAEGSLHVVLEALGCLGVEP